MADLADAHVGMTNSSAVRTATLYPSGVPLATSPKPIEPVASGQSVTTTGWLMCFLAVSAKARATASVPPPAAQGTGSSIDFSGYSALWLTPATRERVKAMRAVPMCLCSDFMEE